MSHDELRILQIIYIKVLNTQRNDRYMNTEVLCCDISADLSYGEVGLSPSVASSA